MSLETITRNDGALQRRAAQPACPHLGDVTYVAARSPRADVVGSDDLAKLHHNLRARNEDHLLENIPGADEMLFVVQKSFFNAQPKKLFVGNHGTMNQDIYAYMVSHGDCHIVKFYVEDPQKNTCVAITAAEVAKQSVLHPFDKTYPKDSHDIDQNQRARLTLMVKWYFIAAGIAKDCVLKETKAYPGRLRNALEYIAKRMGPAATERTSPVYEDRTGASPPEASPPEASPPVLEDSVPPTLADIIPYSPLLSTPTLPCQTTSLTVLTNESIETTRRSGTKRPAENFDTLADMVKRGRKEDLELCRQIDDVEKRLGPLREYLDPMRKQFQQLEEQLEQLEMQHAVLVRERTELTSTFTKQAIEFVQEMNLQSY
jgi:hypothetical protein